MQNSNITKTNKLRLRNYWRHAIKDYHAIKAKTHPELKSMSDFYRKYDIARTTFQKYYYLWKGGAHLEEIGEERRGPKPKYIKSRLASDDHVQAVVAFRQEGYNRYEIVRLLRHRCADWVVSPATVYRICQRYGLGRKRTKQKRSVNVFTPPPQATLAHCDSWCSGRNLVPNMGRNQVFYVVEMMDSHTRIVSAEVTDDIRALTVAFATMRNSDLMQQRYGIRFTHMLTDNGSEWASRSNVSGHPTERLLVEIGVEHKYTRPYRPQTNGRIERFWRTMNDEFIDGTRFESIDDFCHQLDEYLIYYNEHRPHQSLGGRIPKEQRDFATN